MKRLTNLRNNAKPWKINAAKRMSRNKSFPEKILWARLRDKQLGVNVHAQSVMWGYVADFWIPACNIVIEVDGKQHRMAANQVWDAKRDAVMKAKGVLVLRFTAQEVINNTAAVVSIISDRIKKRAR
jgi:very-short-patch-repair endonuclease